MRRHAPITAVVALAVLPLAARAQTMDGKGKGLDALSEQEVMGRLAADGLNGLLDRDFEVFKVPPAERDQQRSIVELNQLANAGGLKPADRRALAERIAKALDPLVAKGTDPAALQVQAYKLTLGAIDPTVTELDYFGENPTAQAQLRPVAETVRHLFQQAAAIAGRQAKALSDSITDANYDTVKPKLKLASQAKLEAAFNFNHAAYALCLSLPKDDPTRAKTADDAIKYLKQYDDPRSNIQAGIRLQVGKLSLAKGDYAAAKATLLSVANGAQQLKPPPTTAEQNEARYFAAVADVLGGKFADAAVDLKDLDTWQQINYLPSLPPGGQQQVRAADAMLAFRLASAQADAAVDPAEKAKFNDQAVTILSTLLEQQQNDRTLHDLVFDQLATRIPEHPDFATLNPLVLLALQQQGFDEYNKKEGERIDMARLTRAIDAARELVRREGKPGVSHDAAVRAAVFVAYALQDKVHDEPAAASAFMDFMQRYPNETDEAQRALQNAGAIVFKLHRAAVAANAPDPAEAALYDRFLPLAVNPPYNQKQIAIDYADVLRGQAKYAEAVKFYDLVPPSDKRYATARFRMMLALFSSLADTALPADQRQPTAQRLQAVATEVDQAATAAAASAKDDPAKQQALGQLAIARFDAATSARRDLHDPAKALGWLDGFEQRIKGLSNEAAFDQTVMVQRINAYMDQGKTADATATLVKLLAADPTAGEGQLFDLIHQIDHDLDVARGNHDAAAERQLAANRAQLSGFLVAYAQASKDPKTQAQLGSYRLYDADSKRQAAELTDDPADRTANLQAALKQYQALSAAGDDSPAVHLGVGLTQYDLGQFADAVASLAPVMTKTGQAMIDVGGQMQANPQFWETYYKQMRSVAEVAKAKPADAAAQANLAAVKRKLGGFFVLYGDKVGGPGYHDAFVKLAEDLKVPTAVKVPALPKR